MRKLLMIVIAASATILSGNMMSAQGKYGADSANCLLYLSYYKEYFKTKNYDDALPNWRKAYKYCPPTANQTMLIDGTFLMRRLISKNAANKEYREALIDTLMTLHDTRAQYYKKYAVTALNNKGTDILNYKKEDSDFLYGKLGEIISANGLDTKPSILMFHLNAAIEKYQKGSLNAEDVISAYQSDMAILEKFTTTSPAEREDADKIKSNMESLFISSKVASCDNLIALFTPRYEANPNDLELVSNIVKMMSSTENCTDNELYLKAVTSLHTLKPSSSSAYFLYRLNASRDNFDEAYKYMREAVSYEDLDAQTAGQYNYELANFCVKNGQSAKAYEAAEKAMNLDPSLAGKAYFLMGTIWGSTSCGGDEISRRSPYWVAVDFMQRAKTADPSLTDEANRMIGQYSVYFPKTADAFMYDLTNGQSYTVVCGGMRATTTVRTQK